MSQRDHAIDVRKLRPADRVAGERVWRQRNMSATTPATCAEQFTLGQNPDVIACAAATFPSGRRMPWKVAAGSKKSVGRASTP